MKTFSVTMAAKNTRPAALLVAAFAFFCAPQAVAAQQNAATAGGGQVDFKACPVFRDIETGCWVATGPDGVTYDLSAAATKPQHGLRIHVKGTVSGDATLCQVGPLLKPVTVTILRTACREPKANAPQ